MSDKRVAKVRVSGELLSQILSGQVGSKPDTTIETDAPGDLRVIGVAGVPNTFDTFWLYVESQTFESVPECAEPPEIPSFTYRVIAHTALRFEIAKLELGPEDVLVVHVDDPLPEYEAAHLRANVEEAFPGHRALVMAGCDLAVARESNHARREIDREDRQT